MVRKVVGILTALIVSFSIALPASAERCSVYESAKSTIAQADTKQAIITALAMIEPLSRDEVNAIIGTYPDADALREIATREVDDKMRGCKKS
jgi:hypothetical protein